jgi:hypothetical protein
VPAPSRAECNGDRSLRLGKRIGEPRGVLAPGARHRGTPTAPASDERRGRPDHVDRAEPGSDRFVGTGEEADLPVRDGTQEDERRRVLRAKSVGECEQSVAVDPVDRLDDDVDAAYLLHVGLDVGLGRRTGRRLWLALQLPTELVERRAQLLRLARAGVQHGVGLP